MKTKRWETMVEKASFYCEEDGEGLNPVLFADVAVDILARQHRAVVNKVGKIMMQRVDEYMNHASNENYNREMRILNETRAWAIKDLRDDILASLAKQGGK